MENNLEKLRHSLSHIMAQAVLNLYPNAKLTIGPAIENGFYYDFDIGKKLSINDLPNIEEEMRKIISSNQKFVKVEKSIEEAKEIFKKNPYKLELIDELQKTGEQQVSIYQNIDKSGKMLFQDLCIGPHVASTNNLGAFKLHKIAGAYWRGDEKNKMLTRIYGLAFENQKELDDYLRLFDEAEKRDHRKLGKELDLFHIDEMVGLGLPLWHPKGAILWRIIEDFWYQEHLKNGYDLVRSPHIGNKILWETSGHWGFYNDSMYPPMEVGQTLRESQERQKVGESEKFLIKPMNCPFHIRIYKSRPHSYKELPMRWAECGTVYRFEKKGELSGLTRVRGFTQDDAHIICRTDQVEDELKKVVDFILFIYKSFGFNIEDVKVYLSVRDPNISKYAGTDDGWSFTEQVLEKVAKDKGLNISKDVGGAVFYGPKLDFKVKDVLGREWQCSTLQFDFNLPEKFDMTFINSNGEKERPYMLHRALFGSFERFIGVLIEHYAGAFPLWLAPQQVVIIPVGQDFIQKAQEIADELKNQNFRVVVDAEAETVGNKIRQAEMQKIPYMIVVGKKEIEQNNLSIRTKGSAEMKQMTITEFTEMLKQKVELKDVNL